MRTPRNERRTGAVASALEGLARMSESLDRLADQVRDSQRALAEMQRQIFLSSAEEAAPAASQQLKTDDVVMTRAEVCRVFGIPVNATTTLKRRQDTLMLPRGSHLCGRQAVTWWKSEIDQVLGMMRSGASNEAIRDAVRAMNERKGAA